MRNQIGIANLLAVEFNTCSKGLMDSFDVGALVLERQSARGKQNDSLARNFDVRRGSNQQCIRHRSHTLLCTAIASHRGGFRDPPLFLPPGWLGSERRVLGANRTLALGRSMRKERTMAPNWF